MMIRFEPVTGVDYFVTGEWRMMFFLYRDNDKIGLHASAWAWKLVTNTYKHKHERTKKNSPTIRSYDSVMAFSS